MRLMILTLLGALFFSACASTPMINDQDVLVADNRGQLDGLYSQIKTDLSKAKYGSDVEQNRQLYLGIVGRKIAEQKERDILNALKQKPEQYDIATLNASLEQAQAIEPYNREVYLELTMQLKQTIENKQQQIADKQQQFDQLGDDKALEKTQLLTQISQLYGGDQGKATLDKRSAYIDQLFKDAELALEQKRNEDVKSYLTNLQQISPEDKRLESLKTGLILVKYERKFWDALSKGDTDGSYQMYYQLTQIPSYLADHPDAKPIAEDMAKYFLAEGDKQWGKKTYAKAYQNYSKANYVQISLGKAGQFSQGQQRFVDYIAQRAEQAIGQQQWLPAYAYLNVLSEFSPDHSLLEQQAATVNQNVLEQASVKLYVENFTSNTPGSSLGEQFANALSQALTAQAKGQVMISQSPLLNDSKAWDKASYHQIKGELLKANVSETQRSFNEDKTVQVSTERVENPDYVAWSALKKSERKKTPEPASIIEQPVMKTVSLEKTHVEKQASVSVSYRLVSALSGKVLFADAIEQSKNYQDTAIKGLTDGLFVQAEKTAQLPDNKAIVDELMSAIANQAAQKIITDLADWQAQLKTLAEQALNAENFSQAEAYYAYAYVLQHAQGQENQDLLKQLRSNIFYWEK